MHRVKRQMRLLATDVDGTIAGPDHHVADRTAQALRGVQDAGIPVVLVTGRNSSGTDALWCELGLKAPVISCGGSLIKRPDTGEIILERRMDPNDVRELLDLGQALGAMRSMWTATITYRDDHPLADLMEAMNGVRCIRVPDFQAFIHSGIIKAVVGAPEERVVDLERTIRAHFGQSVTVTRGTSNFLDVTDSQATKGTALAYLADYLGIPREGVVAIGDSDNDVDMLEYAAIGVAMGNSSASARRAASLQIGKNDAHGVAEFLETLLQTL